VLFEVKEILSLELRIDYWGEVVLWFEMKRYVWGINKHMRKKNCVRILQKENIFGQTHMPL
jgi:hypothetical protein